MGIHKRVEVSLCPFAESPHAQLKENVIQLPSWFLLRYDDIPQRFRIDDIDDPRIRDQDFLNDLARWINGKFREAGICHVVRFADYGIFQTVILLLRDRDLFEKSKDFILAHELAHLNHSQVEEGKFYSENMQRSVSAGGLIGGILLLILALSLIPYVPIAVSLVAGGIGVALCSLPLLRGRSEPARSVCSVAEEKLADMDAVEALQDARGGIYRFETFRLHYLGVRESNPSARNRVDALGNNLEDRDHPPLTERIAYLRQWQASHQRA